MIKALTVRDSTLEALVQELEKVFRASNGITVQIRINGNQIVDKITVWQQPDGCISANITSK